MDYTTSMITDEDTLRGLLFHFDLGFSHIFVVFASWTGLTSLVRPGSFYRDGGKAYFKAPSSMLCRTGPIPDFQVRKLDRNHRSAV